MTATFYACERSSCEEVEEKTSWDHRANSVLDEKRGEFHLHRGHGPVVIAPDHNGRPGYKTTVTHYTRKVWVVRDVFDSYWKAIEFARDNGLQLISREGW